MSVGVGWSWALVFIVFEEIYILGVLVLCGVLVPMHFWSGGLGMFIESGQFDCKCVEAKEVF